MLLIHCWALLNLLRRAGLYGSRYGSRAVIPVQVSRVPLHKLVYAYLCHLLVSDCLEGQRSGYPVLPRSEGPSSQYVCGKQAVEYAQIRRKQYDEKWEVTPMRDRMLLYLQKSNIAKQHESKAEPPQRLTAARHAAVGLNNDGGGDLFALCEPNRRRRSPPTSLIPTGASPNRRHRAFFMGSLGRLGTFRADNGEPYIMAEPPDCGDGGGVI